MADAPEAVLRDALFKLDDCFAKYIAIHNDIFARKLRRIIPIPLLFEKVDYRKRADALQEISDELAYIKETPAILNVDINDVPLGYFITVASEAVAKLQEICLGLTEIASGGTYQWRDYNADCEEYETLAGPFMSFERNFEAVIKLMRKTAAAS